MHYPALPERLLVGVLPGRFCEGVARRAVDLAGRLGSSLEWLHVLEGAQDAEGFDAGAWLESTLGPHPGGGWGKVVQSSGSPGHVLAAHARAVQADWILLGPHTRGRGFDLGSTARTVLAKFDGALWVQPARCTPIRRILVGTDLSDPSLEAVHRAHALAAALGASLTVLHAYQVSELAFTTSGPAAGPALLSVEAVRQSARLAFRRALAAFPWGAVPHELRLSEGPAAEMLLARQEEHDLIVVGSHGASALQALLLGSVAKRVLLRADRPVVVFRHR